MNELEQKDRDSLAVIATELIDKVAKGYLEDLPPEMYIISKVQIQPKHDNYPSGLLRVNFRTLNDIHCPFVPSACADCKMSCIPPKMQDWTPAGKHALMQLSSCNIKGRINLAPTVVFHPKRLNESYDNALSLRSRDLWYKMLFDDLRLDKKGKEILKERGLYPNRLFGGKYFVRWPGYGFPKIKVPEELPVKSERGLAIPALSPFLEIQGLQVKPYDPKKEGKRYHTVGSKKGGSQPLFSLPNGDTPVYCWIPKVIVKNGDEIEPFKIGICEGGLKPAIAASVMNQIFLGSFTRRISDYTLLRYLMDIERKILNVDVGSSTIVVYPDSGTTNNPDVCYDSLYCVFACASQGYDVRIGWWGQTGVIEENMTDEEQITCKCDIDELIVKVPNYKNVIKELSISEFYRLIPEETMEFLASKSFGDPDEYPFEHTDVVSDYYTVYDPNHTDPIDKIIEPVVAVKPKIVYDRKSLFEEYFEPFLDPNVDIEEVKRKEKERKEMIEKEKQRRRLLFQQVPIPPTSTKTELFDKLFGDLVDTKNEKSEEDDVDDDDYDDDDYDDSYEDSDYNYENEYDNNKEEGKKDEKIENSDKNTSDKCDNRNECMKEKIKEKVNEENVLPKSELFNSLFGSISL